SQAMVLKAGERLEGFAHGSALRDNDGARQTLAHSDDVLLINNQLHRIDTPQAALARWIRLCAPVAAIFVLDLAHPTALSLISA
ncbi:hypothetical protein, partial [Pseudomonas syringae group genomosp. 7]|uniref:hypothetical protein n=1 Tax=Pseudomonas syringae group genomosp. 7 TaxID=251699 RepID=UPI00376FF269